MKLRSFTCMFLLSGFATLTLQAQNNTVFQEVKPIPAEKKKPLQTQPNTAVLKERKLTPEEKKKPKPLTPWSKYISKTAAVHKKIDSLENEIKELKASIGEYENIGTPHVDSIDSSRSVVERKILPNHNLEITYLNGDRYEFAGIFTIIHRKDGTTDKKGPCGNCLTFEPPPAPTTNDKTLDDWLYWVNFSLLKDIIKPLLKNDRTQIDAFTRFQENENVYTQIRERLEMIQKFQPQ